MARQQPSTYELKDVTGVYSRAALNLMLQKTIEDTQRSKETFSLLLLDLDHFKSVNDAFGHNLGDKVLTELAHRLLRFSRGSDLVFRYGGDEFVILLKNAAKPHAVSIANRLLTRIAETPFTTTPPLTLTLSLGVVNYPSEGQSAEELFEIADRRHYIAKRSGRGRVVSEDPVSPQQGLSTLPDEPSRLIERDQPFEIFNGFLNRLPEAGRGLFTIYGQPGSGKSRFLSEARKIARLQGYALLSIKGSPAVKSRMFGALDLARLDLENLPAPSKGLPAFTSALFQAMVDKGNAGLMVTLDNLNQIDRFTLDYIGTLLNNDLEPVCILYPGENLTDNHDPLREKIAHYAIINETVVLEPITQTGIRIWLRQSLFWEAPSAFVEWFHRQTRGLPANIKRGLVYLVDHAVVKRTATGREYQLNYEQLDLETILSQPEPIKSFNFPTGITHYIGREDEINTVKQLFTSHRLVTILGPGGSGKSRFALQVASEIFDKFSDGVYFIPLSSLNDSDYLITTLASFLHIPLPNVQDPKKHLIHHLKQKNILLVLDNFETLQEGAVLLAEILAETMNVSILVTSRQQLNLPEEMLVELAGLNFPESNYTDFLENFSAVQLFIQCARRIQSDFVLTKENGPAISKICHLVGGAPLGVELAAAGMQNFTPEQIAEKIEESISFLSSGHPDIPETQRSMYAILTSFWESLSEVEQGIVCKLSVFKTRFCEDAARKVAGASPFFLEALVARSFLRKTPANQFELHGLLRQFASDQLKKSPEALEKAFENHSAYYTDFIAQRAKTLRGSRQVLDEIDRDLDNIRAAWRWAIQHARVDYLQKSARALQTYYTLLGFNIEGRLVFSNAAACIAPIRRQQASPALDSFYIELLIIWAGFSNLLNDYEETNKLIIEAYPMAGAIQNHALLAEILTVWGQRLYMTSDFVAARTKLKNALDHAQLASARQTESEIYRILGNIALDIESLSSDEARLNYQKSLEICRELGDRPGESGSLNNLGLVSLANDEHAEALKYFEQNLIVARQIGDRVMEGISLNNIGCVKLYNHEYLLSAQYVHEALQITRATGNRQDEGITTHMLAYSQLASGNLQQAKKSLENALAMLQGVEDRSGQSYIYGDLGLISLFEGHYNTAKNYCEQSLSLANEIGLKDVLIGTLVTYGKVLARLDETAAATTALEEAIKLQTELSKHFLLVEPYSELARIELNDHRLPEALARVEVILQKLEVAQSSGMLDNLLSGLNDYFYVYTTCFDVLAAAQDQRANTVIQTGYQLLQKYADRTGDEITRQMYLEGIPSHKRLVTEYEQLKHP